MWLNLIAEGASLASKFLPMIINKDKVANSSENILSLESVEFGNIKWGYDSKKNQVKVSNLDNKEKGIQFSRTDKETDIYTEIYHPLGYLEVYDATQDLSDYTDGNIAMSEVEVNSDLSLNTQERRFFAYIPRMAGPKLELTGGIRFEKKPQGFSLKMPLKFNHCNISISDKRGQSFDLSGKPSQKPELNKNSNDDYHECIIELPKGADPNIPFDSISIEVLMPIKIYNEITAERRKLNSKLDPNEIDIRK